MFEELRKLFDVLEKIEALHAGATTPGERNAAASARERIMDRLRQFERDDEPTEQKFTLVNQWSVRLFIALAKRYDLQPFRYYRQRYTTVMLKCPRKFVDEVLWPEFMALDEILMKSLDDVTDQLIAESIFQGSTDVEVRDQALLGSDVPSTNPTETPKQESTARPPSSRTSQKSADKPEPSPKAVAANSSFDGRRQNDHRNHVGRNDPCPCGSGKKYKKCCAR